MCRAAGPWTSPARCTAQSTRTLPLTSTTWRGFSKPRFVCLLVFQYCCANVSGTRDALPVKNRFQQQTVGICKSRINPLPLQYPLPLQQPQLSLVVLVHCASARTPIRSPPVCRVAFAALAGLASVRSNTASCEARRDTRRP